MLDFVRNITNNLQCTCCITLTGCSKSVENATEEWGIMTSMKPVHTVHARAFFLFIRLIVDKLKQHYAVSWSASRHAPRLPHLSLFAVLSDLSISQFIFLQSSPQSPGSRLRVARFLCPLSPFMHLSHFPFVWSVSRSRGNSKDLNAFGYCWCKTMCVSPLTSKRPTLLTLCSWQMRMSPPSQIM